MPGLTATNVNVMDGFVLLFSNLFKMLRVWSWSIFNVEISSSAHAENEEKSDFEI
jgi:hypothetical protein